MSASATAINILGVPISRVDMASAIATIEGWLTARESHYVCACDVHSLMRARSDGGHMQAMRGASMITPDGQPVAWTGRLRGAADMRRVCGPDLMPQLCKAGVKHQARHFFYGGAPGVADMLARRLEADCPGLLVAGAESPPFRPLTSSEEQAVIQRIRASGATVLWIGLGCPKQEKWMHAHRHDLPGVVMIGVGAAFDFHTNRVVRAPVWMRDWGLEWLHRLLAEPRRLWRRYLILAPQFVVASVAETAALRVQQVLRRD